MRPWFICAARGQQQVNKGTPRTTPRNASLQESEGEESSQIQVSHEEAGAMELEKFTAAGPLSMPWNLMHRDQSPSWRARWLEH